MTPKRALISYSHKDESYRASLVSHLSGLVRGGVLNIWSDHQILPGQHIDSQILSQLKEADVILLLISPDFIASDYCFQKELQIALERHENGRAVVVPIVIRPTDWLDSPFANLMMLPTDALPISTWENTDQAWLSVAKRLRSLLEAMAPERRPHEVFKSQGIQSRLGESIDHLKKSLDPATSLSVRFGANLESLDELTGGIWPGELAVIASRPDHGHVELAVCAVVQASQAKKKTLVICQRSAAHQFTNRVICALGRVSRPRFSKSALTEEDWARTVEAIGILKNADVTIDDDPIRSASELKSKISQIIGQKYDLVLIDGLEYLSAGSEERAIALEIADFARKSKAATIVTLSLGPEMELRAMRKPLLIDLSDWRVVENFANKIIFCFRESVFSWSSQLPALSARCEVSLMRSSDGDTGKVSLEYVDEYGIFDGLSPEPIAEWPTPFSSGAL